MLLADLPYALPRLNTVHAVSSATLQANEVASKLDGFSVDYVISSPFRRCLQTSAGVVKQLGLQQGQWLVDWQLSEVGGGHVHV
jgi:broad specificity phosphatase PhoE